LERRLPRALTHLNIKHLEIAGLVLVLSLFALWPIPHTISIRELLLLANLGIFGYLAYRRYRDGARWRWVTLPAVLIVALTVWMLFVAVFISGETAWSLGELRGQWLKGLVALGIGGLAAVTVGQEAGTRARLVLGLCAVLLIHVVAVDVETVAAYLRGETGFRADGLTGGAEKANYLTNILLAFLFAELLIRLTRGARLLPVADGVLYSALVIALFSLFGERVRNGMGVVVVMFLCWAALVLWGLRRRMARRGLYLLAVVALGALATGLLALAGTVKPGSGWRQFAATVPVALDTQSHKGWLNEQKYGLPTLPDGGQVDGSAYARIAWFKEGMVLVGEHPWGVGFGRNAFGHAVTAKYREPKGHSHSSFIDLLVGIGIPGMALWLAFLFSLLWIARRSFDGGWGGALFFLVVDFGTRMVVDSNVRDHMLQTFLFLAGLLGVFAARKLTTRSAAGSESLPRPG
jgi:O-antigen ligase